MSLPLHLTGLPPCAGMQSRLMTLGPFFVTLAFSRTPTNAGRAIRAVKIEPYGKFPLSLLVR